MAVHLSSLFCFLFLPFSIKVYDGNPYSGWYKVRTHICRHYMGLKKEKTSKEEEEEEVETGEKTKR
jgi:hypothetical protein